MTRNTHDREEWHTGEFAATLVELTSTLDIYPAGALIEDVLRDIHERILYLETPGHRFRLNAILKRSGTGSFALDATIV